MWVPQKNAGGALSRSSKPDRAASCYKARTGRKSLGGDLGFKNSHSCPRTTAPAASLPLSPLSFRWAAGRRWRRWPAPPTKISSLPWCPTSRPTKAMIRSAPGSGMRQMHLTLSGKSCCPSLPDVPCSPPFSCRGIRRMREFLSSQTLAEKLPRFLQKCAEAFESDRRYRNDIRYLGVWIQLVGLSSLNVLVHRRFFLCLTFFLPVDGSRG